MRSVTVQHENDREGEYMRGWRGLLYPLTQKIAVEAL
jgi:hypothetical protein